jgi:hypothetical protein
LWAIAAAAFAAAAMVVRADNPANFKPDSTFKGSALTGWQQIGDADWKAQNGELIGTPKPGGNGGWIVMDKSFQDIDLFTNYRCVGTCTAGVLLRAQKTPDGGLTGVYLSLSEGDLAPYAVTLDSKGKELSRDRIVAAGRGGGGGGGGGNAARAGGAGGQGALAAPAAAAAGAAAPAAADAQAGGRRGGRTGGQAGQAGQAAAPAANAAAAPAAPRAGGGGGGGRAAGPALKAGEWNPIEVVLSAAAVRAVPGGSGSVDAAKGLGYGPIAFFVGSGEAHFKDIAWKDLISISEPKEMTAARYTSQRISSFYYGWSAAGSDITHDGNIDIVSGPFYFVGPNFTERRIYREGRIYNASSEYAPDMVNLTSDFTGDGWPDILASEMTGGRPMDLYVNPRGENRRWDKFRVLPTISTEIVVMKDLDKDGKPEIIFGGGGVYSWAKPDPANPTAVWTSHPISAPGGQVPPHGIGVGDVNGDGRLDLVTPFGWYEQPAGGISQTPWTFHAQEFGNNAVFGNGGGEYGVYDVNGDGLTDIVGGQAHAWGINWYEQKKAADGTVSWITHMIQMDFSTKNMGDVLFSESHAARIADMNGDGIPDFVTGKRYWSHLENYNGEDPYGPALLVIYKTVRDKAAPGGARFDPEIVHNKSGVGSSFEVMDINKDGVPDIATATAYGTYVFLSKPAARPAAAKK